MLDVTDMAQIRPARGSRHRTRRATMNTDIYRFKVGAFDSVAASDGTFAYTDQSFFINAPRERLEHALLEHSFQPGEIKAPWTCLYINTGQHRVMVDTGAHSGPHDAGGFFGQ